MTLAPKFTIILINYHNNQGTFTDRHGAKVGNCSGIGVETPVKLKSKKVGEIMVVSLLVDALTTANVNTLDGHMEKLIEPGAKIILDLTRLHFIDSTGIGLIRFWHEELSSSGGQFKLCSLTKQVFSVFELIKLDRILNIFNTREEAFRSFG